MCRLQSWPVQPTGNSVANAKPMAARRCQAGEISDSDQKCHHSPPKIEDVGLPLMGPELNRTRASLTRDPHEQVCLKHVLFKLVKQSKGSFKKGCCWQIWHITDTCREVFPQCACMSAQAP